MIFERGKALSAEDDQAWAELLHLAQLNTLSFAYLTLRLIEDPELITDESKGQVIHMIRELEDGLARFEEYCV